MAQTDKKNQEIVLGNELSSEKCRINAAHEKIPHTKNEQLA